MSRVTADVLLALGVVAVILTGYLMLFTDSSGLGQGFLLGISVLVWGLFAASLVGLGLMYRVWRGTRS